MDVMIVYKGPARVHTGHEDKTEDQERVIVSYRSHEHKLPDEALVFANATELADCIHAHYGLVPIPRHCEEIVNRVKKAMEKSPSWHVNTMSELENKEFTAYRGTASFLVRLPKQYMEGWQLG